jgi:hypothetical protein
MTSRQLVAIYRRQSFSPQQHLHNDRAIMDAVVGQMLAQGWEALRIDEQDVERGRIPRCSLYLNMCQGPLASELLTPLEGDGKRIVNRPSSVLNCHRHRLVRRLACNQIEFPPTLLVPSGSGVPTASELEGLLDEDGTVWVKRGDVHAERPEDVQRVGAPELGGIFARFVEWEIPWIALQRHVPGPVLKFYGLSDRSFFRYYGSSSGPNAPPPEVDAAALEDLACRAAASLGLEIFGGDVALPSPDRPVLIDLNDWPSFAPYRQEAAGAIVHYLTQNKPERL